MGALTLYHGSRGGLNGEIRPESRTRCDFGKGFYMGTNKDQARSLVANVPNPYYYELRFDLDAIPSERILRLEDMNWLEFLEMEFPLEETEQGDVTISYAEAGWIGFVYRHLHFATGLASSELVKKVPFDNLLIGYAGLHTVDEDMAVEILSEDFGLPMVKETEG